MKVKRILSGLLAAAMLTCAVPAAYAAEQPTVKLSSGTVEPGGTVTLTVSIENNPGLAACILYFYYDTSVFTVDPETDLWTEGAFARSSGLICNTIDPSRENSRYEGELGEEGILAFWYHSSGLNNSNNGKMMSINVHVNDTANAGVYSVGLDYSAKDARNQDKNEVTLLTKGGNITIEGQDEETSTGQPPVVVPEPEVESEPEVETVLFTDISGHWAKDYIERAAEIGLTNGMGNNKFEPDSTMTRAQMVTVLWRMLGEPEASAPATFTDLRQDWYKDAVAWAQENSVVEGVGGNKFDPDGEVTREQVVTILHRLVGAPAGMHSLFAADYDKYFEDSAALREWSKNAVYWAVYEEIYCGETSVAIGETLAPRNPASRAQIMVMIVRYLDD